jgi:hypothetical protein
LSCLPARVELESVDCGAYRLASPSKSSFALRSCCLKMSAAPAA